MRKYYFSIVMCLVSAAIAVAPARVHAITTAAEYAYMVDFETGNVLLDKNADERMYPASMTKIMTAYLVFERLKDGRLSLDDELPVSEKAWRKGGSKMFVEVGKTATVEDLIKGVIVQSGNDACIVLAEALAGSEEAFATLMTQKARALGMQNTQFRNSTGWPDDEHYTTAKDLVVLTTNLVKNFPDFYEYYAIEEFTYSGIRQSNRNPLLYKGIGADGVKTGHTEASGYGLVGSATEKDVVGNTARRLIMVLNGMESQKQRADESEKVLRWGFREFENHTLFGDGQTLDKVGVWLGQKDTIAVKPAESITVTFPKKYRNTATVKLTYPSAPLTAPIQKGQAVGALTISLPEGDDISVPLVAAESVAKIGGLGKFRAALEYLIFGDTVSVTVPTGKAQ